MSATDRTAASVPTASDLAAAVRDAGFVRLVAAADGDALAATGLLARALSTIGVPFQASVARTDPELARRLARAEDALALAVGAPIPTEVDSGGSGSPESNPAGAGSTDSGTIDGYLRALPGRDEPASVTAHAVARELGADPDPVLALAGAFAAGVPPGGGETAAILETARETRAVERRPGVALPVADPIEGLAHTTLVHAEFSADEEAAAELVGDAEHPTGAEGTDLDDAVDDDAVDDDAVDDDAVDDDAVDDDADRTLASLVALATVGDEEAATRSADAVERALRPHVTPDGPFATVGGYADVLEAAARERPGCGVALALDDSELGRESVTVEATFDAWRAHARSAHEAVREATTGRYDGLFVARVDGDAPVVTVARLLLSYRSPEPTVLVVGDDEAAAICEPAVTGERPGANGEGSGWSVDDAMRAAVESVGGEAGGRPHRAYARHDGESREVVSAFREARR